MSKIELKNIRSLTLYTGEKGPEHCICKCPCCSQRGINSIYQGTESQIDELLEKTPNLQQLYILGNPDPAVDPIFCNSAAKKAVERGVHVCFSTSGAGGTVVLKKLLNEIPTEMVDYISFSIDSTNPDQMCMLKGINYPWEKAIEGIDLVTKSGYNTRIQPTLWSSNYLEAGNIIEFFSLRGIKCFNFHIGTVETATVNTHKHLTPEQVTKVHNLIQEAAMKCHIRAQCPVVFSQCGENDESRWYCMHPEKCKQLLVFFREKGIYCTHIPIAAELFNELSFELDDVINMPAFHFDTTCPFSHQISGRDDSLCRYISKIWDY